MKSIKYLLILGLFSLLHNIHAAEIYKIDNSTIDNQNYPTICEYIPNKLISMFNTANADQKSAFLNEFKISPKPNDIEKLKNEISLLEKAIAAKKNEEFKKSLEDTGLV